MIADFGIPPVSPRIGSLCSGYGGLDAGVQSVLGGTVAWHSDIDPGASKILAHHWPDVPNLGDMTTVDWSQVEPVDIITAGYPCQPFSAAGKRRGAEDDRHLWPHVATALGRLRPGLAVFENVRGHLTLGLDDVIRDLSLLHYETRWVLLRAADVGAPHNRARLFILARNCGRQLYSRPDRRRGVHRNPRSGGVDATPSQGCDDGQGFAIAARVVPNLRRAPVAGSAGDREESDGTRLATKWEEGQRPSRADLPDATNEGRSSTDSVAVPGDDRCCPSAVESTSDLERGDAPAGACVSGSHSGSEPNGTGCAVASTPAGTAAGSAEVRGVVGAGRRSVRSSGVRWTVPSVGTDDRGANLLPTRAGKCVVSGAATDAAHLGHQRGRESRNGRPGPEDSGSVAPDTDSPRSQGSEPEAGRHLPDGCTHPDTAGVRRGATGRDDGFRAEGLVAGDIAWGQYEPAIRRWESVLGRCAPAPTELGRTGNPRLSPRFVEWMQGLPAGHVTDVPGLSRNEQLKALGNGVVPQQAAAALRVLLNVERVAA